LEDGDSNELGKGNFVKQVRVSEDGVLYYLRKFVSVPHPQIEIDRVKAFIADVVRAELPQNLFRRIEFARDGSLVATTQAEKPTNSNPSRMLLLVTYGGTFPAGSMERPYDPEILSGEPWGYQAKVIRGRGLTEQVASLASAVACLNSIAEDESLSGQIQNAPFELAFTTTVSGETGNHDAVQNVLETLEQSPAWTVVCVATDCQVCIGNKGRLDVEIRVKGVACHSSSPERGKNALIDAAKVITILSNEAKLPNHAFLGAATLTPTSLKSMPEVPHTVPDTCALTYDRRLLPGEEPERVLLGLRNILNKHKGLDLEVSPGAVMFPNELDPESTLCQVALRSVQPIYKHSLPIFQNSAQDAGFFTRSGSETICFGPGDRRFAHTNVEVVPILDVQNAAEVYRDMVLQLVEASYKNGAK
jgi:acetylornithine deacetylase